MEIYAVLAGGRMEIHIMANWKQIMLRGAKLKSRIFRSRKIPSYLTENVTEDLIVLKNLVKVYDTGSIKVLGLKKNKSNHQTG